MCVCGPFMAIIIMNLCVNWLLFKCVSLACSNLCVNFFYEIVIADGES